MRLLPPRAASVGKLSRWGCGVQLALLASLVTLSSLFPQPHSRNNNVSPSPRRYRNRGLVRSVARLHLSSLDARSLRRTTGIGRSSAIALSKAGWSVVVSGRRKAELDETVSSCRENAALGVVGDITREADVVELFKQAGEKFGRVDVLFNVRPSGRKLSTEGC